MEEGPFGPYELIRPIGSGGVAVVWLAEVRETPRGAPDLRPGQQVALKRLQEPPAIAPREAVERFGQEPLLMRGIDHPNVVAVFDVDVADGGRGPEPYMAMEYVAGRTLKAVAADGPVEEALGIAIAQHVTRGLKALQERRIVHRDIKPGNLILADESGVVKIMDFGSARSEVDHLVKTVHGALIGTPLYLAPEQIQGESQELSNATDLHALGLVLYELLAGVHPYGASTIGAALTNTLEAIPVTLRSRGIAVSPFFEALILTLLEKDPAYRIPDAATLLQTLEQQERSTWWRSRPRQAAQGLPAALMQRRSAGSLHGRDEPLDALMKRWREVQETHGRTVLIRGRDGSGKSRLVSELAELVAYEATGAAILYGASFPGGVGVTLGAMRTALGNYLGESELEAAVERYLGTGARLTGAFAAFLQGELLEDGAPALDFDAIRASFAKVLRGIAAERPVLLIVEDLDLASEEGRSLFASLAHALGDAPILLVGTGTDDVPAEWRLVIRGLEYGEELELEPLMDDAVRRMIEEHVDRPQLAAIFEDLAVRADGNPRYVVEYLRALDESDGVTLQHPPPRIRDLLAARLARLDPDAREILELAAVVGYRFDPKVVAEVLDRPLVPLLQELSHLQRELGMVRPAQSDYAFDSHALHELLLAELAPPLRVEYHALVAQALEERLERAAGDEALAGQLHVQLFEQWAQAERWPSAVNHLALAVDHVLANHRHSDAVALIERALSVHEGLVGEMRVDWLIRLAHESDVAGRRETQAHAIREAEALVTEEVGPRLLSRLAWSHGRLAKSLGNPEAAEQQARRAVASAEQANAPELLVTALALEGALHADSARSTEAERVFARLLSIGDDGQAPQARAHAHHGLARIADLRGKVTEAVHYFQGCLDQVEKFGSPRALALSHLNLGIEQRIAGQTKAALAHLNEALAVSREIELRSCEMSALAQLGVLHKNLGQFRESLAFAHESMRLAELMGDVRGVFWSGLDQAVLLLENGLLDDCVSPLDLSLERARELEDAQAVAEVQLRRAWLAHMRGDDPAGLLLLEEVEDAYRALDLPSVSLDCDRVRTLWAYLRAADDEAARILQARLPEAERIVQGVRLAWWEALAAALSVVTPAQALAEVERHRGRLGPFDTISLHHLLWRASGDGDHLQLAHDALMALRERALPGARDSIVQRSPQHVLVVNEWATICTRASGSAGQVTASPGREQPGGTA